MGFFKAFFLAIPLGLYFGEKKLKFPFTAEFRGEQRELGLSFNYQFIYTVSNDFKDLFK
jgi:hypothetical protein